MNRVVKIPGVERSFIQKDGGEIKVIGEKTGSIAGISQLDELKVFNKYYGEYLAEKGFILYLLRTGGLGDVLMSMPVVKALKDKYRCKIVYFTSFEIIPMISRFDFIDDIVDITKYSGFDKENTFTIDFDETVDFLPIADNGHRQDLLFEQAGLSPSIYEHLNFKFELTKEERIYRVEFRREHKLVNNEFIVGVVLGAKNDIRVWDDSSKFVRLLNSKKIKTIVIDSQKQEDFSIDYGDNLIINTTGMLDISKLISTISLCSLIVTPDTGPLHLAGFLGVPFVGIFGSVAPEHRVKYYKNYKIVDNIDRISCSPCYDWQRVNCSNKPDYKICLKSISAMQVLTAVYQLRARIKEKMSND